MTRKLYLPASTVALRRRARQQLFCDLGVFALVLGLAAGALALVAWLAAE